MNRRPDFLERLSRFMIRHRMGVVLIVLVGGGLLAFGATKIKTEVILQHLFPYDHPYLQLHGRFSEVFGGGGFSVVIAVNAKEGDIFDW